MAGSAQEPVAALVAQALDARIREVETVAPGLGTRRFQRLHLSGGASTPESIIARIEAPEDPAARPTGVPPEPALEPLRSFLAEAGLPVPASFGRDPEQGIELLEDVGSDTLEAAAGREDGATRRALYGEALSWLPRLQSLSAPANEIPAFGRRLDRGLFAHKAERVVEWLLPWALGRAPSVAEAQMVRDAFDEIASVCEAAPGRLAHRDYKAANLHLRPERPAGQRLVWIDLQGAFLAPPEYDAVCLLRDPHVPLPDEEAEAHLENLRPTLPDAPARDEFHRRATLLTLTRVGKDLALYRYAAARRGDRRYLPFVPHAAHCLRYAATRLRSDEERPGPLADLANLFGRLPEASTCAP